MLSSSFVSQGPEIVGLGGEVLGLRLAKHHILVNFRVRQTGGNQTWTTVTQFRSNIPFPMNSLTSSLKDVYIYAA